MTIDFVFFFVVERDTINFLDSNLSKVFGGGDMNGPPRLEDTQKSNVKYEG